MVATAPPPTCPPRSKRLSWGAVRMAFTALQEDLGASCRDLCPTTWPGHWTPGRLLPLLLGHPRGMMSAANMYGVWMAQAEAPHH